MDGISLKEVHLFSNMRQIRKGEGGDDEWNDLSSYYLINLPSSQSTHKALYSRDWSFDFGGINPYYIF